MSLEKIPSEIIEKIVRNDILDYKDILSLCCTCRRLSDICSSNDVWRCKFKLSLQLLYEKISENIFVEINWKLELRKYLQLSCNIEEEIENIKTKYFRRTELSSCNFSWFDDCLLSHNPDRSLVPLHVVHRLGYLVHDQEKPHTNLTTKFYGEKILKHVQHRLASSLLTEDNLERISYEECLVLVATWCQPTNLSLSPVRIRRRLDRLAERVLSHLLSICPDHPIFTCVRSSQSNTTEVQMNKLPELSSTQQSMWAPSDCRLLINSSNHVLFTEEGLAGNSNDYYSPDNSYIDRVLDSKLGIPISLCLIHHCVLKRLGVVTFPTSFPGHFLLKWLEHPESIGEENKFTFIDSFECGNQMSADEIRRRFDHLVNIQEDIWRVASPVETVCRMVRNLLSIGASRSNNMRDTNYSLLRSVLELMVQLNQTDNTQYTLMLSRVYLQLNINHEEVLHMLQEHRDNPGITDQVDYLMTQCQLLLDSRGAEDIDPLPKKRGVAASFPHGVVQFWVGQVARHKKYHYVCVIYGWDPVCTASRSWISQMGVDKLDKKDKQPFYNVLVSDGSTRYAAQENLLPITPEPIPHPEVGKYMERFEFGLGYVPNSQTARDYPDEKQVIRPYNIEVGTSS